MNYHFPYRTSLCLLLLFSCVCGCQSPHLPPEFVRMPTATIPSDVQPEDMAIDTAAIEASRAFGMQHSNGISASLYATYEEQFEDAFYSFHIASGKPFIGRGWLLSSAFDAHDFAVLCWIDYIQVPCNPNWGNVKYMRLEYGKDIFFPVIIPGMSDEVHDVQFLAVQDPFLDIDADNLQSRSNTSVTSPNRNIYVGGSNRSPEVKSLAPITKSPLPVLDTTFFISKRAEPVETQGVEIWLSDIIKPGDLIEFYIHFNGQDDPNDRLMAIMAFIDYEQVPLHVEGVANLPLYIRRKTGTWQPVAVQLYVPDQVGVYELLVIVRSYAHHQLEIEEAYIGADVYSSQRVRLEVRE